MTKDDINGLFELLRIYFPNAGKTADNRLKAAWLLVLEPYEPQDVKRAVVEQLRSSPHFPDPQSIAVRCSRAEGTQRADSERFQPSLERIKANNDFLDAFLSEHDPGWEERIDALLAENEKRRQAE